MNDIIKKNVGVSMIQILEGTVFIENKELFLKKIKEISDGKSLSIQAFDADKIAGKEHLTFAIEKAIESFKKGKNVANDLGKEIMLYAAGTRQINRAVKIGVHDGWNNIVIVAVGDMIDRSVFYEISPRNVLKYDGSKNNVLMDIFKISEKEIEAVGADKIPELVLERVALVDVMK
ncbi:MAG: KEOPS complex subunit Cgi121 [Candidatus Methanoperedens sp.]|nr:KEOPS complex subunit Cgi121 [Candidatus Methanoperedens sp.]